MRTFNFSGSSLPIIGVLLVFSSSVPRALAQEDCRPDPWRTSADAGTRAHATNGILWILQPQYINRLTPASNFLSYDLTFATNELDTPAVVEWWVDSYYETREEHGAQENSYCFSSQAGVPHQLTIGPFGGHVVINAYAYTNGVKNVAYYREAYFTGNHIPEALVTERLSSLYATGATPRLLTGIAQIESTYHQFKRWFYGMYWPTESYDGGSHIGLMQVPTTYIDAWDWTHNTESGSIIFGQKLAVAARLEKRIRRRHPELPSLTPSELENMALTLYGPHAKPGLSNQYYRVESISDTPIWVINTDNNPLGVAYADRAREKIH